VTPPTEVGNGGWALVCSCAACSAVPHPFPAAFSDVSRAGPLFGGRSGLDGSEQRSPFRPGARSLLRFQSRDASSDKIERAQQALLRFGAPRNVVDAIATAELLDVVWMGVAPARIDLMKGVPGGDFARAWSTRVTHVVAGTEGLVVSRDELIALKRASGRPRDLLDAERLLEA